MYKKLPTITNFKNKTVFLRTDYNVPIKNNKILDNTRIKLSLPTIKHLLKNKNKVVIATHLKNKIKTDIIAKELKKLLKHKVLKLNNCINQKENIKNSKTNIIILENLRLHKEEKENNTTFAKMLAEQADVYVNDAFGTCHRKHTSVNKITKYFSKKYIGFLIQNEIKQLNKALKPKRPMTWVIGGVKINSKLPLIKQALKKSDAVLIGGAIPFTFYKSQKIKTSKNIVDKNQIKTAKTLLKNNKLILPIDFVNKNNKPISLKQLSQIGYDLGPQTIQMYKEILKNSKTVIWNGPLGYIEKKPFDHASKTLANTNKNIIAGGGETALIFKNKKITHLSTGGGASLEYLTKEKLPALEILLKK